jgi:hypothetical protein
MVVSELLIVVAVVAVVELFNVVLIAVVSSNDQLNCQVEASITAKREAKI